MTSQSDLDASLREAASGPSKARLLLLILEGYLYLAVVLGVLVGAVALLAWGIMERRPFIGLIAVFVGLPLLLATVSAIRSLFFRIPEPEGAVVTPDQAPELHRVVDDVRRTLGTPRVYRVVVGESFNASALQVGRVGIFFPRSYLVVGYPLFATLSPEHLRAVIAHELGHLSRTHGRISVMVYRMRQSWRRLMRTLRARELSPVPATILLRWYGPRLHAASTAISRRQELLADRLVAQLAGTRIAAETLVSVVAGDTYLEQAYWSQVYARADHEPEPPYPFAAMSPVLWQRDTALSERVLSELLVTGTEEGDTHPSLRDRLSALGEEARLPPIPERSAAEVLLGQRAGAIAAELDAQWRTRNEEDWKARHVEHQQRLQRLRELDLISSPGPEHHYERGEILEELEGAEQALPHYEAARAGGHGAAALAVGRIRLERRDDSGIVLIEEAMDSDESLVPEGCEILAEFLEGRGKLVEAHRYAVRARRHGTRQQLAATERERVTAVDRFVAHGLSDGELSPIIARLEGEPGVARAMLVSRELRHSAGRQLILAVTLDGKASGGLAERVGSLFPLPGPGMVVVLGRHDDALRSALAATPGAEMYERRP